jgi:hypothetical protein
MEHSTPSRQNEVAILPQRSVEALGDHQRLRYRGSK